MCFLDPILVASVCHGLIYLRNDFDGITIRQELGADGNHLLPSCTPTTAIELSWVSPNCTSRRLAVHLPARSCATITANRPGSREMERWR